jgi:hypothetical protein
MLGAPSPVSKEDPWLTDQSSVNQFSEPVGFPPLSISCTAT